MSRLTTLSCAGLLASCLVVAGPAPAYAETDTDCTTVTTDTVYESPVGTSRASLPFTEMGVDHAWDRLDALGKEPGEGVVVAVLDSGVVPETGIPLAGHPHGFWVLVALVASFTVLAGRWAFRKQAG